MRFARDFDGILVDAETNNKHGYFICLQCHNLAHWRKESIDQRRPHFYHATANEDCPLSVTGGSWNLIDDENVEFIFEHQIDKFIFKKEAIPNLSRISSEIIRDSEIEKRMSQSIMKIRLASLDVSQIDSTVLLFCNFLKNQEVSNFCAIPLPVKIKSFQGSGPLTQRIHRRLIHIKGLTPILVDKFSSLNIPESVNIEFGINSNL